MIFFAEKCKEKKEYMDKNEFDFFLTLFYFTLIDTVFDNDYYYIYDMGSSINDVSLMFDPIPSSPRV